MTSVIPLLINIHKLGVSSAHGLIGKVIWNLIPQMSGLKSKFSIMDFMMTVGNASCPYLNLNVINCIIHIVGARSGKHWFIVKDVTTRVQKMLTITPKGHHMAFVSNSSNRNILTRIFSMLKVG